MIAIFHIVFKVLRTIDHYPVWKCVATSSKCPVSVSYPALEVASFAFILNIFSTNILCMVTTLENDGKNMNIYDRAPEWKPSRDSRDVMQRGRS